MLVFLLKIVIDVCVRNEVETQRVDVLDDCEKFASSLFVLGCWTD